VIVCCVYKRRKEAKGADDYSNNSNTGCNIELITDGSRKPYL
jgi:hypothetical protein